MHLKEGVCADSSNRMERRHAAKSSLFPSPLALQVKMDNVVGSIYGIDLGSQNVVGFKWNLDPSSHEASNYTIVYSDLNSRLFV